MDMAEKIKKEKEKLLEERRKALEAESGEVETTTVEGETHEEQPPETEKPETEKPATETDAWEQRYRTLEGKYRAEVPRLHQQTKELTEKLEALTAQLEERVKPPATQEFEEDGTTPVYRSAVVTDEIRNSDSYKWRAKEYGISEAEYSAEMSILTARSTMKPVEDRLGNIQVETAQERFDRDLGSICPSWTGVESGINVDPAFAEWLTAEDQLDAANVAYVNGDVQKLARIIQRYEKTTTKPPAADPNEQIIAPVRKGGGKQTQIDNAKGDVLRYADMIALYDSHNRGEWRGKEAEYQKKKAEFMKAQSEGRLI